LNENEIARQIVDAAYKIHTKFGPGLLESAYEAILIYELRKRGLRVEAQKPIPIIYEGITLEVGFRADLIVEDKVIVELKSVEEIALSTRNNCSPIFVWPINVWACSSTLVRSSSKMAS
jgi:GxxExxY protein